MHPLYVGIAIAVLILIGVWWYIVLGRSKAAWPRRMRRSTKCDEIFPIALDMRVVF